MAKKKKPLLIELSWEVCNKVGGINTVIKSKADNIIDHFGDDYMLIGPYFPAQAQGEFDEQIPENEIQLLCKDLESEGITVHYGRWLTGRNPRVLLIDFSRFMPNADGIKKHLWDKYQIDSLNAGHDFNEPIVWAHAAGKVIEALSSCTAQDIIVQAHEWLAGPAILHLDTINSPVKSVFTTHATTLGRALAANGVRIYDRVNDKYLLEGLNPEEEAHKVGVVSKWHIERAAAKHATIFTTVSEITSIEATAFLQRKPDVITPNGLDMRKYPTFEDCSIRHDKMKKKMQEFMLSFFFPYYQFDINNTLFFYLSGRYEYDNKGIDYYIASLAELNNKMKEEKSDKHVVAFIWVPTGIAGVKLEVTENKIRFKDIKDTVDGTTSDVMINVLHNSITNANPAMRELLGAAHAAGLTKKRLRFAREGKPPLCTHNFTYHYDKILDELYKQGLHNREEDKVKVIFYPIYLTGADGLLDLDYNEALTACHLGVFPSYYEPWGYTPLESIAYGVPAVTADTAGFGRFVLANNMENKGLVVIRRMEKGDQSISDLTNFMFNYVHYTKEQRVDAKLVAKKLSEHFDWGKLIEYYLQAYKQCSK